MVHQLSLKEIINDLKKVLKLKTLEFVYTKCLLFSFDTLFGKYCCIHHCRTFVFHDTQDHEILLSIDSVFFSFEYRHQPFLICLSFFGFCLGLSFLNILFADHVTQYIAKPHHQKAA